MPRRKAKQILPAKPPTRLLVKATANADGSVTVEGDLPLGFPRRVWVINDMLVEYTVRRYLLNAEAFPTLDAANAAVRDNGPETSFVDLWTERSDPQNGPRNVQVGDPRELERIVRGTIADIREGYNTLRKVDHQKS